ncbi:MAG: SMC-Scp complex subunit ScpB [Pseudomonadales bacterium]|nr:SMC-Scp complex subunit ScpB [Pseudomonadales bacterium]
MTDVDNKVKMIVEGLLMAAGRPLTLDNIIQTFARRERPDKKELKAVIEAIAQDCDDKGFELKQVASGYRFQVKQELSEWVAKLWEERPPRYTRALLETLALIAYRQPITRGDIEEIRGVTVSPNIIRTLLDREWVRVVGHRDVPGRPAMFATTKQFLDYFNLKSLQELPPLAEVKELVPTEPEIDLAEELAKQRVIEIPEEDLESAEAINTETEKAELLAEEEALELSRKPLDEILNMGTPEDAANDEDEIAQANDSDDEEQAATQSLEEESESVTEEPEESVPTDSEADEGSVQEADILEFSIEELEEDREG